MILELSKSKLIDVLYFVSKTVSTDKSPKDVAYKSIQFVFKNNELILYTYNGTNFCRAMYGSLNMDNFSFFIEYEPFYKLVSSAKEDIISLDITKTDITFKGGKSKYKIQYIITQSDFSYVFVVVDHMKVNMAILKSEDFDKQSSILRLTLPKQNDEFKNLQGIYFDGSFAATDMKSLAIDHYTDKVDTPIFIAFDSFIIISKLLQEKNTILTLSLFKNSLVAESGTSTYILTLLSDTFPNHRSILNRVNKHMYSVTMNTHELLDVCKKLVSFTDSDRSNFGRLQFNQNNLIITASSETKSGEETIDIINSNITTEIKMSVNLVKLSIILSRIKNNTVTITFSDSHSEYAIVNNKSVYIETTLNYK
jgi:hypothetical protein